MPIVRTTLEPWRDIYVTDVEYIGLLRIGLIYEGAVIQPPPSFTDAQYAELANPEGEAAKRVLAAALELVDESAVTGSVVETVLATVGPEVDAMALAASATLDGKVAVADAAKIGAEAARDAAEAWAAGTEALQEEAVTTLLVGPSTSQTFLSDTYVAGVSVNKVGTLPDLQAAVDKAAARGNILYASGYYEISGSVVSSKKMTIVGTGDGLTIVQLSPLTPHFMGTDVDDFTLADATLIGLSTDYENTPAVYGASAIKFAGVGGRIRVSSVNIYGIAGAGVFVGAGATHRVIITKCEITGVGLATLGAANYSAGVVIQDGVQNVTVKETEIYDIAQGVSVGHGCIRVSIIGNRIHDTSEHGAYLAPSDFYTVTGNTFYNTGLLGMKIQKGLPGYSCKSAIITGNHFDNTGSTAILLTNAIDEEIFLRNAIVADNIITDCGDTAVRIDHARGIKVTSNTVDGARFGIRVYLSSIVSLIENDVMNTERTGILIDNSSRVKIKGGTLMNLGILGPEKVGIIVQGVVDNLLLDGVTVDYDVAAQSDGLLFGDGTYSNIRVRNGYYRGANWGTRTSTASSAIIQWRDNIAIGGTGTTDGLPLNLIPSLPNTTGAPLATVEASVNKLNDALRAHRDARG